MAKKPLSVTLNEGVNIGCGWAGPPALACGTVFGVSRLVGRKPHWGVYAGAGAAALAGKITLSVIAGRPERAIAGLEANLEKEVARQFKRAEKKAAVAA